MKITLNITREGGELVGQVELDAADLRHAWLVDGGRTIGQGILDELGTKILDEAVDEEYEAAHKQIEEETS